MDRDASLVNQMKQGDERALSSLIARHHDHLQYFIYCKVNNMEDAEDLTWETLEEAYAKIDKYNPTHKFSTWLFTIGKNKTTDFIRRKARTPRGEEPQPTLAISDPSPEQILIRKQEDVRFNRVLGRLKEKDRKIIEMRLDGHRYEAIARSMKMTPQGARTRFFRSIRRMGELMGVAV